jgi:hypothetical protein
MADITLGSLIALIYDDLAATLQQTAEQADLLRLHVSDVDLDIPAHLRLPADPPPPEVPARLMVTLPSTRETPPAGRLGRIHVTFERLPPTAAAPPGEEPP